MKPNISLYTLDMLCMELMILYWSWLGIFYSQICCKKQIKSFVRFKLLQSYGNFHPRFKYLITPAAPDKNKKHWEVYISLRSWGVLLGCIILCRKLPPQDRRETKISGRGNALKRCFIGWIVKCWPGIYRWVIYCGGISRRTGELRRKEWKE